MIVEKVVYLCACRKNRFKGTKEEMKENKANATENEENEEAWQKLTIINK